MIPCLHLVGILNLTSTHATNAHLLFADHHVTLGTELEAPRLFLAFKKILRKGPQ